jgi:hypothetical protein
MNDYRERLELSGLIGSYERARQAQDCDRMKHVLTAAKFTPLEIESILWSKGDIGAAPTDEEKRASFRDAIIGRVGTAVISGVLLGGLFAYVSADIDSSASGSRMERAMRDYRSPKEAYYRPFIYGFVIGSLGALITGTLIYDPTQKA